MDTGIFYVLIGFLFFCSFLFTFLTILKLFRGKVTWATLTVFFLVSGLLTVLVFSTGFLYEISFPLLTWYCIVVFLVYIICRIFIPNKKLRPSGNDEPV